MALITGMELFDREYPEEHGLWGSFIEKGAINSLIGGSDTGKSTLLRRLAIAIVTGEEQFLNFDLESEHKKVLVVSTEDPEASVGRVFQNYYVDLRDNSDLHNLHFEFSPSEKLLEDIECHCTDHQYDLIIIDAFLDVFNGSSPNDQSVVRRFLKAYRDFAQKNDVAILFLHHLNKRASENSVGKQDSMGSAAYEQAMRSVFSMSKDGYQSGQRKLAIVKGNYASSAEKRQVHIINFDETTLDFEFIRTEGVEAPKAVVDKVLRKNVADYLHSMKVGMPVKEGGISFESAVPLVEHEFGLKRGHSTLNKWYNEFHGES